MTTEEIRALERVIAALGDAIEVMPEDRHLRQPCVRVATVLSRAIARPHLRLASSQADLVRFRSAEVHLPTRWQPAVIEGGDR